MNIIGGDMAGRPAAALVVEPAHWAAPFRSAKGGGILMPRDPEFHALLLHLEADPRIASYRRFDPAALLSEARAQALARIPFFSIAHDCGPFVVGLAGRGDRAGRVAKAAFERLDGQLALTSRWLLEIDPETLREGVRWRNVRLVAAARFAQVHPDDRRALLDAVDVPDGIDLVAALRLLRASPKPIPALFSLVCDGTVALDLDAPLDGTSKIRSRLPLGVAPA